MKLHNVFILLVFLFGSLVPLSLACTSPVPVSSVTIAMVIDTKDLENDDFNKICISGAEKAKNDFGTAYEYGIANSNDEYYQVQKRFAELKKYALIICVGGTQVEALNKSAVEFPNQKFALIDAAVDKPNVVSIQFHDEQSSFLAGAVSAQVTKRDRLSFIGGMDIPAIKRYFAGYYAGAKYIKPGIGGVISYIGSWSNQERAANLALIQFAGGSDVIFSVAGAASLGVIDVAKENNFYVIGTDTDQRYRAKNNVLISTLKKTDIAVYDVIKSAVKSNFKAGTLMYGLKEDGVGVSIDNALPVVTDQMKMKIKELQTKIISGEITVPYK